MPLSLELMPLEEKPPEPAAPKTMVVRFGYLLHIGEFPSDITGKVGCGTKVVVKTDRGVELAEMLTTTCGNGGCSKSITREKLLAYIQVSGGADYPFFEGGRVLRVATAQDLAEQAKLDEARRKDINMARELVVRHNLEMKIVEVEYLLGGERVLFYFTSEHRIDFRGLVRDMAHELHTRIELRQVGARDDARLTADYEKCGQHCCCKQFLKVLTPISMKSAKIQKATLDPAKISGRCGRLMCCLRYEDQTYEELRKKLPKRNTRVTTEKGDGWVVDGQILTQLVMVQYDDFKREAVPIEKILAFDQPKPKLPDGRTMQSPNDRPPMQQGDPNARGPGGPRGGPGGPRGGPNRGPANAPAGPTPGVYRTDRSPDGTLRPMAVPPESAPPNTGTPAVAPALGASPVAGAPAPTEIIPDPSLPALTPDMQGTPRPQPPRPQGPRPQGAPQMRGPQGPRGGGPPQQQRGPQGPRPQGPPQGPRPQGQQFRPPQQGGPQQGGPQQGGPQQGGPQGQQGQRPPGQAPRFQPPRGPMPPRGNQIARPGGPLQQQPPTPAAPGSVPPPPAPTPPLSADAPPLSANSPPQPAAPIDAPATPPQAQTAPPANPPVDTGSTDPQNTGP